MSKIEFETDKYYSSDVDETSKLTKLIIKLGAKDADQANKIMLGIAVLIIIVTGFIIINNFSSKKPNSQTQIENIDVSKLSYEEIKALTEAGVLK